MKYPGDFPVESRAKVEAARIRAGRRFDSDKTKARWNSDIEALFKSYVLTMFLAFAKEAQCLRLWPVDKMRENCQEFLRLLTIEAYFQKGKAAGLRDMISNWNGSILWEFQQEIEKTPQWREFENILLRLAEGSTGEKQVEPSQAQNGANLAQDGESKSTTPVSAKRPRLSATVSSLNAARRMEAYLQSKAISQTDFAISVNTTDRTLRAFRKTGKVRRDIFEAIAKAMNITKEQLLNPE